MHHQGSGLTKFASPATDLGFLTLMCNWTAALSEGSDEIVAALNEAGYSAEVHVVDMSKEIKQKMKSLVMFSG